jgi:AcrR family transcriptional regulator
MPASPRRRRLTPADRREELLRAGDQVIRAHGRAATIEDVARAAGAARGTFYVYFPTWEHFVADLRARAIAQLDADIRDFEADCGDWRTVIRRLPELFIALSTGLQGLHEAVLHAPGVAPTPADRRDDLIERLRILLAEGHQAGAVQADDPEAAAWFAYAVCCDAAGRALEGEDPVRIADVFGEALVRAFAALPVERRAGR